MVYCVPVLVPVRASPVPSGCAKERKKENRQPKGGMGQLFFFEHRELFFSAWQDSVLQLGIVSSYPSRGGIKVCSRPLWGLISAGYQGSIGGRAAKRQFTPRTEDRALPRMVRAGVSFKLFALPPYPRAISALLAQRIA